MCFLPVLEEFLSCHIEMTLREALAYRHDELKGVEELFLDKLYKRTMEFNQSNALTEWFWTGV